MSNIHQKLVVEQQDEFKPFCRMSCIFYISLKIKIYFFFLQSILVVKLKTRFQYFFVFPPPSSLLIKVLATHLTYSQCRTYNWWLREFGFIQYSNMINLENIIVPRSIIYIKALNTIASKTNTLYANFLFKENQNFDRCHSIVKICKESEGFTRKILHHSY